MKILHRGKPKDSVREKFPGEWRCPECWSKVAFDDNDTVRDSWTAGEFGEQTHAVAHCPICGTTRDFEKVGRRKW